MVAGVALRTGAAVTTRLTLTVCGLAVAPAEVIVTVPLKVPAAKPVGLTATLTVPGVVPLAGVAESHVPPEAATVKFNAVPDELTEIA